MTLPLVRGSRSRLGTVATSVGSVAASTASGPVAENIQARMRTATSKERRPLSGEHTFATRHLRTSNSSIEGHRATLIDAQAGCRVPQAGRFRVECGQQAGCAMTRTKDEERDDGDTK